MRKYFTVILILLLASITSMFAATQKDKQSVFKKELHEVKKVDSDAKSPLAEDYTQLIEALRGKGINAEEIEKVKLLMSGNTTRSFSKLASKPNPIPMTIHAIIWDELRKQEKPITANMHLSDYEKFGSRSPKWDSKVRQYLLKYSQAISWEDSIAFKNETKRLGKAILDSGCTDPLVTYAHGNIVNLLDGGTKALPFVNKALPALEKSAYPRIYSFYAARKLQSILRKQNTNPNKLRMLNRKKMIYLGQAAGDHHFVSGNHRYYMDNFIRQWNGHCGMPPDGEVMMQHFNKNKKVDPWIRLVVQGKYHIAKAWQARGGGWGSSVKGESWNEFSKQLSFARECLTEAHNMHPEYPEAAILLISVTMGSSCGDKGERYWFDEAVSAHFDHHFAYNNLIWALRPRWGGSHAEMYQFGLDCLATKRFDTEVPQKLLKVLWDIGSEMEEWRDVYKADGVYDNISVLIDGLMKEPTKKAYQNVWKSTHAMLAWAAGKYDIAQSLFKDLGDNVHEQIFADFGVTKQAVLGDLHLRTSPLHKEFDRAELLFNRQNTELLPTYKEILKKSSRNKFSDAILNDRIQTLELKEKLLSGDWVSLIPVESLSGWEILNGDWTVLNNTTVKGVPDNYGLSILCKTLLTGPYEFEGVVDAKWKAGIQIGCNKKTTANFIGVMIDAHRQNVSIGSKFGSSRSIKPFQGKAKNKFLIRVLNDTISVFVNDALIFTEAEFHEIVQKNHISWSYENGRIGLGSYYTRKLYLTTYSNLRLRLLDTSKQDNSQ